MSIKTRQLYNPDTEFFTEFSKWLRVQPELCSKTYGLDIENVDYIIHKFKDDVCKIMLVEEKRYMYDLRFAQRDTFSIIDQALKILSERRFITTHRGVKLFKYYGFHLIQFEKTNPDDGKIFIDGKEVTRDDLITFLKFEKPEDWYISYFDKVQPLEG